MSAAHARQSFGALCFLITRCGAALILNVPDDATDIGYIEALIWRNWAGGLAMSQLEF
jgi:hypothetical protein